MYTDVDTRKYSRSCSFYFDVYFSFYFEFFNSNRVTEVFSVAPNLLIRWLVKDWPKWSQTKRLISCERKRSELGYFSVQNLKWNKKLASPFHFWKSMILGAQNDSFRIRVLQLILLLFIRLRNTNSKVLLATDMNLLYRPHSTIYRTELKKSKQQQQQKKQYRIYRKFTCCVWDDLQIKDRNWIEIKQS